MQDLPVMYWITKIHNNPISFRFIVACPICSIKPLTHDIISIFKLFYEKVESHHTKGKILLEIKIFWTI